MSIIQSNYSSSKSWGVMPTASTKMIIKKNIMLVGLFAVLGATSCTKHEEEKKEEAVKYQVTSPLLTDTTITKEYVGQVRSIRHIEMRAQQQGYIQKIFVDEGQTVKEGQMMFQIMPKLYEAELQKAQAEANYADIEYQNTKKLADSKIVAPTELAMANAKFNKAKADVSLAEAHLGFTKIRAPFSGIMDHFQVRLGSLVNDGDLLTTLSDNSQMWVYFNVPEAEYLNLKEKASEANLNSVSLKMANNKLFQYPGKVQTIEADFDNTTGNIQFRATFPNPKGLLRHGETGNIEMKVPIRNAIIIPQKATFEVLEKKYVYVIDKENKVRSREIKVAAEMPHIFVVSSGLNKDDKILLEGLRQVKENEKIAYKFEKPATIISNLGLYAE